MKETYKNLQGLLQKQNAMKNTVEYMADKCYSNADYAARRIH